MSNTTKSGVPLLEVRGLKMYFPVRRGVPGRAEAQVKAVDGISFSIPAGETFGLVGESGCGKTTVGKCVLRIIKPTGGSVLYNGTDITEMSDRRFSEFRRDLQLIFQDPYGSLDPRQSASSILREAIVSGGEKHFSGEVKERIGELLALVGLDPDIGGRFPHEMSGGQRQRLGIARALACEPKLIVCDEPVSALDVSIQAQIINLFKELQKKLGLTYLFIAHDLAVVRHIADRIGVMYLGHLVELIDSEELFTHPVHPYTRALLSAVPITSYDVERARQREVLQGEVPSPINAPSGCPFHPRCKFATGICSQSMPELCDRGGGHFAACHHPCDGQ